MSGATARDELAAALDDSLSSLPQSRPRVLLWLDPEGVLEALQPLVAADSQFEHRLFEVKNDSQVALKLALLARSAAAPPLVVYLPDASSEDLMPSGDGLPPRLWALTEFRFVAAVWNGAGQTQAGAGPAMPLPSWLELHSVRFVDRRSKEALRSGDSARRLARYVARHADEALTSWPVLSDRLVVEDSTGHPRDRLMEFLLDPTGATDAWGADVAEVRDRIGQEYGVRWEQPDPEAAANDVAASIALTDAWDALGRRDDFPFSARLPRGSQQRDRCLRFLRTDLMRHFDAEASFRARIGRLESDWTERLASSADSPSALPLSLPSLAERILDRALGKLISSNADELPKAIDSLRAILPSDPALTGHMRSRVEVARDVAYLMELVRNARAAAEKPSDAHALVQQYADSWHLIDGAYLRIQATASAEPSLADLRKLVDRTYFHYVSRVNDRFSEAVERDGIWPPPGTELSRRPSWRGARGRAAVVITDALRLDVALDVAARVGSSATVEVGLTTLPTTTPFGMSALLPLPEPPLVDETSEALTAGGINLESREDRKRFLEAHFKAEGRSVDFLEVTELLHGKSIGSADLVVLFDYELDNQGHGVGSLPHYVEGHAARLARAVARLHELGVRVVEMVTDHGFLHHPAELSDSLGTPRIPAVQRIGDDYRYAVLKPDAPVEGLIRLQSPLAPSIPLGFARGVRALRKAKEYMHGGVSLQECVIAVVRSESAAALPRLGVEVAVSSKVLTTGTVAVSLNPTMQAAQLSLGGVSPITIRLSLVTVDDELAVEKPVEEELRLDTPPLTRALYLREGVRLSSGDILTLVVDDARTSERIDAIELTMGIDWE